MNAVRLLDGVLMLAAHSARSQAYLQSLLAAGLAPQQVLLLGQAPASEAEVHAPACLLGEVRLPDLGESLQQSLAGTGIASQTLDTRDVNDPRVLAAIRQLAPQLIVYSGYGGQLVGAALIDLGIPLLHIHSGWLPDFRGSTTAYYSLLEEGDCAASAILLDKQIDTGPLIARKRYPAPPRGTDIDRRYDTGLRADLLVQVLRDYQARGRLQVLEQQEPNAGRNYYVIHPLLKHLALLGLPGD